MKEFDIGAYQRKWQGAIAIVEKDTRKVPVKFDMIEPWRSNDGKNYIYARCLPFGECFLHEKPGDAATETPILEPVYHPFDSGVYVATSSRFVVLTRNHKKTYTCGITNHSFHINNIGMPNWQWDQVHWLAPIIPQDYNGKELGYISRKIWWQQDKLYYLNTLIGYILDKKVKVNNALYVPYLRSVFKKCQVEVL